MKDRPERFAALLLLAGAALALAPGCTPLAGQTARLKGLKAPRWTVPGLDLEMVRIPPGTFLMGSPPDEPARRSDETQHQVTISRPFYIGVYEVTQGQYYKLMLPDFDLESWEYKRGPLHKGAAFCYRDYKGGIIFGANATGGKLCLDHPMESVTWDEAVAFCRKLTEIERNAGRLPEGYVYRLPTEAEWEYACRAGTSGPLNVQIGFDYEKLKTIAHVGSGWTSAVSAERRPNAWGLYDMHGNVYEWCLDWYGPYPEGPVTDPTGPPEGRKRVARGGCFIGCDPQKEDPMRIVFPFTRSASRYAFAPHVRGMAILGFRVVLAPELGGTTPEGH